MDTKKQKKPLLIAICILSALLVLGLVLGLTVFFKFRMYTIFSNRGSRLYSPAQIRDIKSDAYDKGANDFVDDMKGRLENGTGINTVLREIYTEDFIYTVDGKYYFSPINFDLKMNKLNNANFSKNSNGEITYSENGAVVSHKGIDISRYQGNIDFSKVKQSGVEYAIIRCGYRGYSGGTITDDSSFDTYMRDALSNDIKVLLTGSY